MGRLKVMRWWKSEGTAETIRTLVFRDSQLYWELPSGMRRYALGLPAKRWTPAEAEAYARRVEARDFLGSHTTTMKETA